MDLDVLVREIEERPAGKIDETLRQQIELVQKRRTELRLLTERLELQRRNCGSMPTGACRSAFEYFRARREDHAGLLRMDRMKLEALIAERQETLKNMPAIGAQKKLPEATKKK